ncbi:hypothetical protein JKP88DRAFT_251517 [Tribonema minus]|uniref:Uncharacterized protein n=1 Tax=Tribonema minus TaxID=303371 RepID=A0A835ZG20_9STRA|nr:hypothetical protein JKP88DRAFT_251517 [Tribonema minus]
MVALVVVARLALLCCVGIAATASPPRTDERGHGRALGVPDECGAQVSSCKDVAILTGFATHCRSPQDCTSKYHKLQDSVAWQRSGQLVQRRRHPHGPHGDANAVLAGQGPAERPAAVLGGQRRAAARLHRRFRRRLTHRRPGLAKGSGGGYCRSARGSTPRSCRCGCRNAHGNGAVVTARPARRSMQSRTRLRLGAGSSSLGRELCSCSNLCAVRRNKCPCNFRPHNAFWLEVPFRKVHISSNMVRLRAIPAVDIVHQSPTSTVSVSGETALYSRVLRPWQHGESFTCEVAGQHWQLRQSGLRPRGKGQRST